ncbi:MAG: cell cycle transcriptional regulator TrcR, partial [Pseudomonadota bacterium]|nr:cell cycle transcriptional regulator TrcR [Pseudomonadota bacterium]
MTQLLMPKATAVWLIDNTALSFDQIADLCGLHPLEVQSIADGETGIGIQGDDPIQNGQLTREEIARCEGDPSARLVLASSDLPTPNRRTKGPRYVPVARRGDKPDGIAWLVKHHPELKDSQIVKLIGTTKETITKIRERTHLNISNISAKHPAMLG